MNCGNPGCQIECHHRRQETGRGWAKCLDCGAGYGWPGIIPEAAPPTLVLFPGDVLTFAVEESV